MTWRPVLFSRHDEHEAIGVATSQPAIVRANICANMRLAINFLLCFSAFGVLSSSLPAHTCMPRHNMKWAELAKYRSVYRQGSVRLPISGLCVNAKS